MRAADPRRGLIAAIHVRAKQMGLDADARADLQERLTGRRSCREMSVAQLRQVADDLRLADRRVGPRPVDATRPRDRLDGMRARALALAGEFGAADAYLDAIARRQSGVAFAAADATQLRAVIAAAWRHAKRQGHDVA